MILWKYDAEAEKMSHLLFQRYVTLLYAGVVYKFRRRRSMCNKHSARYLGFGFSLLAGERLLHTTRTLPEDLSGSPSRVRWSRSCVSMSNGSPATAIGECGTEISLCALMRHVGLQSRKLVFSVLNMPSSDGVHSIPRGLRRKCFFAPSRRTVAPSYLDMPGRLVELAQPRAMVSVPCFYDQQFADNGDGRVRHWNFDSAHVRTHGYA